MFYKIAFFQTYTGKVIDNTNSLPLESVSVYFDGTTVGVTTNADGVFSIALDTPIQSTLVISYIGYEKLFLTSDALKNNPVFKRKEKQTFLDEVVIFDDWSRKKKMDIFKQQFLGFSKDAAKCKIENEDALNLTYNKVEDKLYASSNEPLIIENKVLGYIIYYDLADFELSYGKSESGFKIPLTLFYAGTSKFDNSDKKR